MRIRTIIRFVGVTIFFVCWWLAGWYVRFGTGADISPYLPVLFLAGLLAFAFLILAFRKEMQLMKENRWAEISIRKIRIKCLLLFLVLSLVVSIHHYLIGTPLTTLLTHYANLWILGIIVILLVPIFVRDRRKELK